MDNLQFKHHFVVEEVVWNQQSVMGLSRGGRVEDGSKRFLLFTYEEHPPVIFTSCLSPSRPQFLFEDRPGTALFTSNTGYIFLTLPF